MPLQWSGISFMGIYTKKEAFKRLPYIVGKRRLERPTPTSRT